MKSSLRPTLLGIAFSLLSSLAIANEYPIGNTEQRNGMEIKAVYLQPIRMEPEGMMRAVEQSDIHLEADIHALAINPNGFPEGFWIPYLRIDYLLTKDSSKETIKGEMMPMVASDGPHYGDNVKLMGPGKYRLTLTIYPPNATENHQGRHFGRHTDRLTGVRPWFEAFTVSQDFVFAGIGKKGGY